jgi:hypothetical protein
MLISDKSIEKLCKITYPAESATMEECIKCMLGVGRHCVKDVNLSWHRRVKHHAAYVCWEQMHYSESQADAVGDAVQVDLLVAEGMNRIMDIRSISDGRICLEIDARICQTSSGMIQQPSHKSQPGQGWHFYIR